MQEKSGIRDYLPCTIFEEVMRSLDKALFEIKQNNPNIDSSRLQQQQILKVNFDVQQFIEGSLKTKYIVLLEYSKHNFPDLIAFFLDRAQKLIRESTTSVKELKTSTAIELFIFYDLILRCCDGMMKEIYDSDQSDSKILFNNVISNSDMIKTFIIEQSLFIYHFDFPKDLLFLRNRFSSLLSSLGSHYSCFYDFFFQHISQIFTSSTLPSTSFIVGNLVSILDNLAPSQGSSSIVSKYLPSILSPITRLPGDNNGLNVLLSLLKQTLDKTTSSKSSYRQPFSDTILQSIIYFFKMHFYLNNENELFESSAQNYDYKSQGKTSQALLQFPKCPLEVISSLAQLLETWNEKHNKFTWPTQVALLVLSASKKEIFADPSLLNDHSLLNQLRTSTDEKQKIGPKDVFPDIYSFSAAFDNNNRKSLINCMENFPNLKNYQKEFTTMALLVAFKIYSLSCRNTIARDFSLLYYENFLDYYLKQKIPSSVLNSEFFTKILYVDFPICVLFIRKNETFHQKILPILKDKSEGPLYLAKIIRRLCRQGSSLKFDQIFDEFIDITVWMFNKAESDSPLNPNSKTKEFDCKQILVTLITAFTSYPTFTKKFFCMKDPSNTKNVDVFIESARKHPDLPWHSPLILLFETFTESEYFSVINNLLRFLFEMYCKMPLDQQLSQFEKCVPKIIETAAMSPVFQQSLLQMDVPSEMDSELDEESESTSVSFTMPMSNQNAQHSFSVANLTSQYSSQSLEFLKKIIPTLEMSALMLIASSRKSWRNYGVNIINSILNFAASSSLIELMNLKMPIDLYHSIAHDATNKNIPVGHESYKNPLRRITFSAASIGYTEAWTYLYKRLVALTITINPKMKIFFEDPPSSQKSKQKVKDLTVYEAYLPPLQDEAYLNSEQAQLNPLISSSSGTNNEIEVSARKNTDLMSEWIGCASILFAVSAYPNNNLYRMFNESFLLIYDTENVGPMVIGTLPQSLNANQGINYIKKMAEVVDKLRKADNISSYSKNDLAFIQNLIKILIGFLKQDIFWEKDVVSPNIEIFSSLIQNFIFFCNTINEFECRKFCCQMIVSILTLTKKFETGFEPTKRHEFARTLLSWISVNTQKPVQLNYNSPNSSGQANDGALNTSQFSSNSSSGERTDTLSRNKATKELTSNIFPALALLLDNLSFLDCIDPNDPRSQDEQAEGVFISYFFVFKAILERNAKGQSKELIPVLTALLKQNIDLGIYHCISCTFALKDEARAAFITAMASVFKSSSEEDDIKGNAIIPDVTNLSLGDILFTPGTGLDLIEYVCEFVPYSCANAFGASLIEVAISKGCEYQLLDRLIDMELRQVDPLTKNSLFRGNAVPANAVGYLPRLVGTKWMEKTLRPLFEEVISNCQKGLSYVLDPDVIKANLPPSDKSPASETTDSAGNKVDPLMDRVNEQLEKNRENVREMLLKSTETIFNAFDSMPVGIIKEAQLIYKKVYEMYGDFAFNILGGFLFLRFLLPPFTLTNLVGLPPVIDEKPRKALVDQCRILNSAINKGTVDDKPEYQCFIDTAKTIHKTFNEMFKKILKADVKDRKDDVTLDLEKANNNFHSILYSSFDKMNKKLQSGEDLLISEEEAANPNSQNQKTLSINSSLASMASVAKFDENEDDSDNDNLSNENEGNTSTEKDDSTHLSPRVLLGMLLMKLQSLGEPEKTKKASSPSKTTIKKNDKTGKVTTKKTKFNIKVTTFENFMKSKVKAEDTSKYSNFLVKEENNAPDGSAIYYMFFDKLDSDDIESRELYLPYYVLKTLNEEKNPKIILVLILSKFDPSKLPSKNLRNFLNMAPANKIQKYVLLETNQEFIEFIYDFERQNESSGIEKLIEVNNLSQYSKVVGFPSKHLPFTCIESLSQANSTHTAHVVFKQRYEYSTVCIHRQSIQLISDPIPFNSKIKFKYIKFIIISHISSLTLKDNRQNNNNDENENETCIPFIISTKEGEKFLIKPTNAALYDAVYALRNRPVSLQQMSNKSKKIDELTLQWLMLNLAYSNLIIEDQQSSVRKASLDLTYSIFHAFSFKRSITISKIPEEAIPTYLLNYVVMISEDISKNNPDGFEGFINEFFYEMREMRHTNKNLSFEFLRPWIVSWLNNIDKNPEFTKKMFNNILISNAQPFVGSILIDKVESLEYLIKIVLKSKDQSMCNQIVNYSFNLEKEMSYFIVDTMLKECLANAVTSESEKARGNHLTVIIGIISQLINSTSFYLSKETDVEEANKCITSLLYNICDLRLIYSQEVLNKNSAFFGNILRFINRNNEESISFNASDVCNAFASRDGLKYICNEFSIQHEEESYSPLLSSTGADFVENSKRRSHIKFDLMNFLIQKRNWLSSTQIIASAIKDSLKKFPKTLEQLYSMYVDILINAPSGNNEEEKTNQGKKDSMPVARITNAIIFATTLVPESQIEEFVYLIISLITKKDRKDYTTFYAISFAFSNLKIPDTESGKKLISKIFYTGVISSLYLRTGVPLELIASSIHDFFGQSNETEGLKVDSQNSIESSTNEYTDHLTPTESTENAEEDQSENDEDLLKLVCEISVGVPENVISQLTSMTGLPFDKNPVFSSLVLLCLYALSPQNLMKSIEKVVNSKAISDPFVKVLSLVLSDEFLDDAIENEFGENSSTVIASCLFILKLAEEIFEFQKSKNSSEILSLNSTSPFHEYLLWLQKRNPEIFAAICNKGQFGKCMINLIHEPQTRYVLISKCLLNKDSKNDQPVKFPKLISSMVLGDDDSDQKSYINPELNYSYESAKASLSMDSKEITWWNMLATIKRSKIVLAEADVDSLLDAIVDHK